MLTLKQTGKVQKSLPVVLFGTDFWQSVVNWKALVEYGTISQDDVDSLFFTDSPEDVRKKKRRFFVSGCGAGFVSQTRRFSVRFAKCPEDEQNATEPVFFFFPLKPFFVFVFPES